MSASPPVDPKEQFELRVRPVLAKNCYACHAGTKLGGLQLDTREAALRGGKSGPAIVPGDPDSSLLIQAVRQTHSTLKMPPSGRLTQAELEAMTAWVRDGAVWPERPAAPRITPEQRNFWSFQSVRKPVPPAVKDASWPRSPIDRFILSKLEQKGLMPAGEATSRAWLRRVTFDLTGLPPTPEQVTAFESDRSDGAYAKVADRLLASPRYGERWGRHWLDVARYADDVLDPQVGFQPSAYPYRDWVIQAFNDDMPYDLFVKAQFAADLLPGQDNKKLLPALGFFIDPPTDGISDDDRVDALTRGFLGLTVACAKCHDHKYDPIPTKDYYSLLGIFRSTQYGEVPLVDAGVVENYNIHRRAVDDQDKLIKEFVATAGQQLAEVLTAQSSSYLMAARQVLGPQKKSLDEVIAAGKLDREVLERWIRYVQKPDKEHPYLKHWEQLLASGAPETRLRQESHAFQLLAVQVVREKKEVDEYNRAIYLTNFSRLAREVNDIEGKTMTRDRFKLWQELAAVGNPNAGVALARALVDGVVMFSGDKSLRFLPPSYGEYVTAMRARLKVLKAGMPAKYPFLSVIEESPQPANLHVAVRGNVQNRGEEAPRAYLTVFRDLFPEPFTEGSGRLQLAEAVASPKNPLTARVMVNRIWESHFGYGLVRTPSNFGQTGDRPAHPELLDYLASRFIEQGWSMKKLHREIVLSAAYRLSQERLDANFKADPDNRLHWRYPLQRLDAETLRDGMLFVTGTLDETMGGPAVALDAPANRRRTLYGRISRKDLDPMLSLFDFPNPVQTSEQRVPTTVPLQRLFLLNSPLVMSQGVALAARLDRENVKEPAGRIHRAYQLLFQRKPSAAELQGGMAYIAKNGPDGWALYGQVLLASNEFLYAK